MEHYTHKNAIALRLIKVDSEGATFETVPHPDRLNGIVMRWDGIELIVRNWDGVRDLCQHFESGDTLLLSASIVRQLILEANLYRS
jgi:hypothetical protein